MYPYTLTDAAAEVAAHRARITELEAWLESCGELLTGSSFAAAVLIAEEEISRCEGYIAALTESDTRELVAA